MNDWLCQLLDVNFSLICEDDSCYEVARLLVEMERIVKKRDQTRMEEFVARLPKVGSEISGLMKFDKTS